MFTNIQISPFSSKQSFKRSEKSEKTDTYAINFRPLREGGYGTIEFRQSPGVENSTSTRMWIAFACSFIQAAMHYAQTLNPASPPGLDYFKRFLKAGTQLCGIGDPHVWDGFFHGKSQLPLGAYDLKGLMMADLDKLAAKAKEGNLTVEKFKKLHGYK